MTTLGFFFRQKNLLCICSCWIPFFVAENLPKTETLAGTNNLGNRIFDEIGWWNFGLAGNVGIRVGCSCREDDGLDGTGTALLTCFNWPCLLRGSNSTTYICIIGADHERRIHRCSQLRPLHSHRGAMEWATGHDRLLRSHCHGTVHSQPRISLKDTKYRKPSMSTSYTLLFLISVQFFKLVQWLCST